MGSYWFSGKSARGHDLVRHTTSLKNQKRDSHSTELTHTNDKPDNRKNRASECGQANIIGVSGSSSCQLSPSTASRPQTLPMAMQIRPQQPLKRPHSYSLPSSMLPIDNAAFSCFCLASSHTTDKMSSQSTSASRHTYRYT